MVINNGKEAINLENVTNIELQQCTPESAKPDSVKIENGTPDIEEAPADPGVDLVVWFIGGRAKTYHYPKAEDGQVGLNQFSRCMDAKLEAAQTLMGTLATAKALGPALRMIGILG